MNHTPTPWHVEWNDEPPGYYSPPKLLDSSGENVPTQSKDDQTALANIAFLLKAVNRNHLFDEMVEALQAALRDWDLCGEACKNTMDKARAILAKLQS